MKPTPLLTGLSVAVVSLASFSMASDADQYSGPFDWKRFDGETVRLLLNKHPYTDGMLAEVEKFTEMTGINVEYDIFPEEEYFNKVTVELSSRSSNYDVFMTGAYQTWQYAPAGWIQPLDPFIENSSITNPDFDYSDFLPGVIGSLRWDLVDGGDLGDGELWALPWGFEANALMYNKVVFDQLGLEPPETLDEVIEIGRIIEEETDMTGIAVRGTRSWATIHPGFLSAYNSAGGEDYDAEMNPVMNSDVGVEFADKWVEMVQEVGPSQWTTYTWYDVGNALGSRQVAMIWDADILGFFQNVPGASEAAGEIAWAPGPSLDGVALEPNIWIWSIAMNNFSEKKGAAWYWMQWATGKEFLTTAAIEHNTVDPVRTSVWENPQFQERLSTFEGYLDTFNEYKDGAAIHFTPQANFFETTTEWASALHQIYGGQKTSQKALDDLAKKLR